MRWPTWPSQRWRCSSVARLRLSGSGAGALADDVRAVRVEVVHARIGHGGNRDRVLGAAAELRLGERLAIGNARGFVGVGAHHSGHGRADLEVAVAKILAGLAVT